MSTTSDALELETDVLVIGGGPAAVWAALTARAEGARVVLVDKGFCGSSGVAAAATTNHWWVGPDKLEDAMAELDAMIGLGQVKEQVRSIAASIEAARRRAVAGNERV